MRWPAWVVLVVVARAIGVRLTVGPRRRYWQRRGRHGDLVLVALGDSLTQGIGSARPATSWLGRFVTHVESTTGRRVRIENRAVYGARIADLIADQLPVPADADIVTMCIGANDSGRTDPETFRADLRRVCGQLPPGSIVGDVPEFQWGPRIAAAAELSQVVRDVVAEFPDLVPARVEFHTSGTRILTELAGNFFHPAGSGYRRIAAAFVTAYDSVDRAAATRRPATAPDRRARPARPGSSGR